MKAVQCTAYGPPEVLQLTDLAKPVPGHHDVLIKIHATTAHIGDIRVRKFDVPRLQWLPARLFLGLTRPKQPILGMELAGEIEAIGQDVTRFKPGDPVFAMPGAAFGAYAEYRCMSEDGMLAHKPANLTFDEAAAVPAGCLTALLVLRKANIQRGQTVLIYGASGSVGTYAIQLAKYFGATVTGVCSTGNLDLVGSLGADAVLDYTRDDFTRNAGTYDVVFDAVSKLAPGQAKKLLKRGGVNLDVGRDSNGALKPQDLVFLKELIEAGQLKPVIDRTYPLDAIRDAHRYVEKGHKKGNVVIRVVQ